MAFILVLGAIFPAVVVAEQEPSAVEVVEEDITKEVANEEEVADSEAESEDIPATYIPETENVHIEDENTEEVIVEEYPANEYPAYEESYRYPCLYEEYQWAQATGAAFYFVPLSAETTIAAWHFNTAGAIGSSLTNGNRAAHASYPAAPSAPTLEFIVASETLPRQLHANAAGASVTSTTGSTTAVGLQDQANNAWWQTQISTVGKTDIEVEWRMRSNANGPRDWRLDFSTNGTTWTQTNISASITIVGIAGNPANWEDFSGTLPAAANNQSTLYLRWVMTSNYTQSGGQLAAGGAHQINNIVISGTCTLMSITQANALTTSNEIITVEGYVAFHNNDFNIFIQDGTNSNDGILISGGPADGNASSVDLSGFAVGQWIRVTGTRNAFSGNNRIQVGGTVATRDSSTVTALSVPPASQPTTFAPVPVTLADLAPPNYRFMRVSLEQVQIIYRVAPGVPANTNTALAELPSGQRLEIRQSNNAVLPSFVQDGSWVTIDRAYVYWWNGRTAVQLLGAVISETPQLTIAQANALTTSDEIITVEGYVSFHNNNFNIFIQDGTNSNDGILISGGPADGNASSVNLSGFAVGQWIRVTGTRNAFSGNNRIQVGGTVATRDSSTVTALSAPPASQPTTFAPVPVTLASLAPPNYRFIRVSLEQVQIIYRVAPGVPANTNTALAELPSGQRLEIRQPNNAVLPSFVQDGSLVGIDRAYVYWWNGRTAVQLLGAAISEIQQDIDSVIRVPNDPAIIANIGGTATFDVETTGIPQGTALTLPGSPVGISLVGSPVVGANGNATIQIQVANTVAVGTYNLSLAIASLPAVTPYNFSIAVTASTSTISINTPRTVMVAPGGSASFSVVAANIPANAVLVTSYAAPAGVTLAAAPIALPTGTNTINITVNTTNATPLGFQNVVLQVQVGGTALASSPASGTQALALNVVEPFTGLVMNHQQLVTALATAPTDGTETVITLGASFSHPAGGQGILVVPIGANIVLTSQPGQTHTLTQTVTFNRHFNVYGNLTLENVILSGGQANDFPPLMSATGFNGGINVMPGGSLTMEPGATIMNTVALQAVSPSGTRGGGVFVAAGAEFIMNGGNITGNLSGSGGGVWSYGNFTMNGGNISNNFATTEGGGASISQGTFTMEGGTISNNTAGRVGATAGTGRGGGGVRIASGGTFNLNNGTISDNAAADSNTGGGGIHVAYGTLNMTGGSVTGNGTPGYGGGIFIDNYSTTTPVLAGNSVGNIAGGVISGNISGQAPGSQIYPAYILVVTVNPPGANATLTSDPAALIQQAGNVWTLVSSTPFGGTITVSASGFEEVTETINPSGFAPVTREQELTIVLDALPSVSVGIGTQLTVRRAGTATFPVTTTAIADGMYTAIVDNLPTGVTVQGDITITNGAGVLTLVGDTTTIAGSFGNLTLTIDGITSDNFTLTIVAVGVAPPALTPDPAPEQDAGSGTGVWAGGSWATPRPVEPTPEPPYYPVLPQGSYEYHQAFIFGDVGGTFRPSESVTRAEVTAILVRTMVDSFVHGAYPAGVSANPFLDITQDNWYYWYVIWAYATGFVRGFDDNTFKPNEPITRQEYAAMLTRTGVVLVAGDIDIHDVYQVSGWARDYVYTAFRNGWMVCDGTGNFRPLANINRAEVATATNRILGRIDSTAVLASINVQNFQAARAFSDVADGRWYFASVLAAANNHRLYRDGNGEIIAMYIMYP